MAHGMKVDRVLSLYECDPQKGLKSKKVEENLKKYGANILTEKKPKTLIKRLIDALFEPMMAILLIAFFITLGVNIGKAVKGVECDFYECIGIFIAISISTALTVIMEGKSEKAFKLLKEIGDTKTVKVIRDGEVFLISKQNVVVGDLVLLEAGNKIPADGRIVRSKDLRVDESTLTGESKAVKKDSKAVLSNDAPLAERINMVYGGTYVESGSCSFVVTSVGDKGEIGKIAEEIGSEKSVSAPLQEKLSRLGKMVSIFGGVSSFFVFLLSLGRLILTGNVSFDSVQDVFIESIVLIVAAVPEGLPTTVAISLTLNVVRLAKSNALIRKLVATETVGCVSVICSDKTGTLTKNEMTLSKLIVGNEILKGKFFLNSQKDPSKLALFLNVAVNSTAEIILEKGREKRVGSATEYALLKAMKESGWDYSKIRKSGAISQLTPFSSDKKYMETAFDDGTNKYVFIKGAPEKVLEKCLLSKTEKEEILSKASSDQKLGGRVIAFAHSLSSKAYSFDGYAVLKDSLREDVCDAIKRSHDAGIKVKILTGDNAQTATAIALEAGLSVKEGEVMTADQIEKLSREELKKCLEKVTVIARSAPSTKLLVVCALQEMGEVVAVTGDGVNDAPAIRHADIGISMGDGSEITKQASDVVLLDNSFSTILTAISFGRNVYSNFQRFITFQLTVNLASMAIIIASLIMGFESPFSSACLLWLNVIMDGPLALSLGLEMRPVSYLSKKPVRRSDDILSGKILLRIGIHSLYMCLIVCLQRLYNFMGVRVDEQNTVIISTFVFFQVFNAVNCREVSSQTAFKGLFNNKLLIIMIFSTYLLHILITTFFPSFFQTAPLSLKTWLKITLTCFSVILMSEGYKLVYRSFIALKSIKKRTKTGEKSKALSSISRN